MPILSLEKAALLLKSYKIQLSVLLFLVLDQLVTPFIWNFSENLIERKKRFFNQVWTSSFVGLITWFVWKTNLDEMTMWFPKARYSKLGI